MELHTGRTCVERVCATRAVVKLGAIGTALDGPRRLAWIGIYTKQACVGHATAIGLGVFTQRTDLGSTDLGNTAPGEITHDTGLCGTGLGGMGHAS
jgi:hypothetical protein